MHGRERSATAATAVREWPRIVQQQWRAACDRLRELERLGALPSSMQLQAPNKTDTLEDLKTLGTSLDREAQRIACREEKERIWVWKM